VWEPGQPPVLMCEELDPQQQDKIVGLESDGEGPPPAALECLLDLEHSWGMGAGQTETPSTVSA